MNILDLAEQVSKSAGWNKKECDNAKTHARRFAKILGFDDPKQCEEHAYTGAREEREKLITAKLPDLKPQTIKNMKTVLNKLFREAEKLRLIRMKEVAVLKHPHKFKRLPSVSKGIPAFHRTPYRLPYEHWSQELKREYSDWEHWSTAEYVKDIENRKRKLRQSTITHYRTTFECFFGYLVNVKGLTIETLKFSMLSYIELIKGLVEWHINNRMKGRVSRQVHDFLKDLSAINKSYPPLGNNEETVRTISKIKSGISKPIPVIDKKTRMASFEELFSCGISEYPRKNQFDSNLKKHNRKSGVVLANRAGRGLATMLIATTPLRNKNFREAQIEKHIYKNDDGNWYVRFTGEEGLASLKKVRDKNGDLNVYKAKVHPDVVPYLEEYIDFWRPLLTQDKSNNYLFMNTKGKPYTGVGFGIWIQQGTMKWLGKRVNPHLFRDSIATQRLAEGGGIEDTAMYLNDEPATVYKYYYQPMQDGVTKRVHDWMSEKLRGLKDLK